MSQAPTDEPRVEERPPTPYAGATRRIRMDQFEQVIQAHGEVFGRLHRLGIPPDGPPFFRYLEIDMEHELVVEACVPVAAPVEGDDEVRSATLPGGRYAVLRHVGPPEQLVDATGRLLDWGAAAGVVWDADPQAGTWGARVEIYHTDPDQEPDTSRWVTDIAIRLADTSSHP